MTTRILILIVFIHPAGGRFLSAATAEETTIVSPDDLWRGYDPEALALDLEKTERLPISEYRIDKIRFTGEIVDEKKIRVFGYLGVPDSAAKVPGILHIHGGGQTASIDWVRFWNDRGHACASIDFCGPWAERVEYTDWGPVEHANMAKAQGGFQVRPTPRNSSWFHWATICRRALTVLAREPAVDAERLGIFGISMGGTLTWMVAASDSRVKAAVPIYGCGYNIDPRRTRWGLPAPNDEQLAFKQVLSPEAHAPSIRCPVLFLNATNDFHGPMDAGFEILAAVPAVTRQAYTPRYNHHVEPEQGSNLPKWMDWHLRDGTPFPETPMLTLALDGDGVPRATIDPGKSATWKRVRVFYSLGDRLPQNRFWREAVVVGGEGEHHARLPVLNVWEDIYSFANVEFEDGVCLTSPLAHCIPGQKGKAKGTLAWSADPRPTGSFSSWVYGPAYVDPLRTERYVVLNEQDSSSDDLKLDPSLFGDPIRFHIASHFLGDPQFVGRKGYGFAFEVKGGFQREPLRVRVTANDGTPGRKVYEAKVPAGELVPGFRSVLLQPSQFTTETGEALSDWSHLDKMEILGETARESPPHFRAARWQVLSKDP